MSFVLSSAATQTRPLLDGSHRDILMPGERTYDPAGISGDPHASERIGGDCFSTQCAVTIVEVVAALHGATTAQLDEIQSTFRSIIEQFHGRVALFEWMATQVAWALRMDGCAESCQTYPDFVAARQTLESRVDANRAHTQLFLSAWARNGAQAQLPPQYYRKLLAKDGEEALRLACSPDAFDAIVASARPHLPCGSPVRAKLRAHLASALAFNTDTTSVDNMFSYDAATGVFTLDLIESGVAYGATERTSLHVTHTLNLPIGAESPFTSTQLFGATDKWGINFGGVVRFQLHDQSATRDVYICGERTYDPAGLSGDPHASERIGGDCFLFQTAVTIVEIAAIQRGATAEQLSELMEALRPAVMQYHGRMALFDWMHLQVTSVFFSSPASPCPSYPCHVRTHVDITLPARAHTRAFLASVDAAHPQPPSQYFHKVLAKDGGLNALRRELSPCHFQQLLQQL